MLHLTQSIPTKYLPHIVSFSSLPSSQSFSPSQTQALKVHSPGGPHANSSLAQGTETKNWAHFRQLNTNNY